MERAEIKQLLEVLNDNMDDKIFDETSWVIQTVKGILDLQRLDTINIYGRDEIDNLRDDLTTVKTEVNIDSDYNHVTMLSSQIDLYTNTNEQFIDFEIDHDVHITRNGQKLTLIEDLKESEEVDFNTDLDLILLRTDYSFTSEMGLQITKELTIYVPVTLSEIEDEGVDY